MPASNFSFLQPDFPELAPTPRQAEHYALIDPRVAVIYTRLSLEQCIVWMYQNDPELRRPEGKNIGLFELIQAPGFRESLPPVLFEQLELMRRQGNKAAHDPDWRFTDTDALRCVKALHGLGCWLVKVYAGERADDQFDEDLIPTHGGDIDPQELARLQERIRQTEVILVEKEAQLSELTTENQHLKTELDALRQRKTIQATRAHGSLSETETREIYIDLLLRESGWNPDDANVREYSLPNGDREHPLRADYVLWGQDGLPLAVVEAKRTRIDPRQGERQAELYANELEKVFGRRPLIYYTNGFRTWCWDDGNGYPPRPTLGFRKADELELLIQRRSAAKPLDNLSINPAIADRYYQKAAITAVGEHYQKRHRRALLVMATGSGKTRTAAALVDALSKAGWVKRVLFLADRTALVRQAYDNFKVYLPSIDGINLCAPYEEQGDHRTEVALTPAQRLVFSTYQTILNRIDDDLENGVRFFGPGHFDLIIVDEAHRSIYNKYRAVFSYFDALVLGLTATPKAETEIDTYEFFGLPPHEPTYAYELSQAVDDVYLVPYQGYPIETRFLQMGLKYSALSDDEKRVYEDTFTDSDGNLPAEIDSEQFNKWLFNQSTIDSVLVELMERGQKIEGGDKLGKTIIFAKKHTHAQYIVERFNALYPQYGGKFCRLIDNQVKEADGLIREFTHAKQNDFNLAVSVDMLDTGIDIPEVLNLVFFKRVLSKSKFWQMIGRGTRLRENLFAPKAPGDPAPYRQNLKHKQYSTIFDPCGNFDYFEQNLPTSDVGRASSLSERIFVAKLRLASALPDEGDENLVAMKKALLDGLYADVRRLDRSSVNIRPTLQHVEKFSDPALWSALREHDRQELIRHVAPLILYANTDETARRFDLLLYQTQLGVLTNDASVPSLSSRVKGLSKALQTKTAVPVVQEKLPLIQQVAGTEFWQSPPVPVLERVRSELRELIQFIDRDKQGAVYTNFADEIARVDRVYEPTLGYASMEVYQERMQKLLRDNQNHLAIIRLRTNQPITESDLAELGRMLFDGAEFSSPAHFQEAVGQQPLGVFIRRIVGLDRHAAKAAFSEFLDNGPLSIQQQQFINTIIDSGLATFNWTLS